MIGQITYKGPVVTYFGNVVASLQALNPVFNNWVLLAPNGGGLQNALKSIQQSINLAADDLNSASPNLPKDGGTLTEALYKLQSLSDDPPTPPVDEPLQNLTGFDSRQYITTGQTIVTARNAVEAAVTRPGSSSTSPVIPPPGTTTAASYGTTSTPWGWLLAYAAVGSAVYYYAMRRRRRR